MIRWNVQYAVRKIHLRWELLQHINAETVIINGGSDAKSKLAEICGDIGCLMDCPGNLKCSIIEKY